MTSGDISDKEDHLRRIQTAESVFLPISREDFEKLYLNPKPQIVGDLRKKFGNPTPLALMGFLIAGTPFSFINLGWRGAGGGGGAIIPVFIFFGGMLQILGGIGEWIIGNTLSCVLFFTYGCFWMVQGTSMMPSFATGIYYSDTGNFLEGLNAPEYHATAGFFYVMMSVLSFIYLICSIRTNVCLFATFFMLVITFALSAGSSWQVAAGNIELGVKLLKYSGGFNIGVCIPIWWIFIAQILEAADFPYSLPVGDLSTVTPGRRQKIKESMA